MPEHNKFVQVESIYSIKAIGQEDVIEVGKYDSNKNKKELS